jgi:osmotically-inducible protein OsmY
MRTALRRAGLALVAAGTLGIVPPALAQKLPEYPLHSETAAQPMEVADSPQAMPEGEARLLEIKVELALMADLSTFPYHLAARASGGTVEVRGYIPNDIVRQRAMKIARDTCSLEISDELRTHPTLSYRSAVVAPRPLEEAVLDALQQAFPEASKDITVKARPNGEVTLTGSISSWEEKLAVSHSLRKVRGCSAVVNHLKVPTTVKQGLKLTRVSADGEQMVPAEFAEDLPPGMRAPMMGGQGNGPNRVMMSPANGEQVDTHWVPTRPAGNGKGAWTRGSGSPYSPYPAMAIGKTNSGNWQHSSRSAVAATDSSPGPDAQTRTEGTGAPADEWQDPPAPRPKIKTTRSQPTGPPTWESGTEDVPAGPLPVGKDSSSGSASKLKSAAFQQSYERESETALPPVTPTKVNSKGSAHEAAESPPEPRSLVPPKKSEPTISEKPYESKGVATLEDPDGEDEPVSPPVPATVAQRMKECIEKACAGKGRNVEVTVRSANSLMVRLKARNTTEGASLSKKILDLPELGPYQVNLEVKVAP